VGYSSVHRGRGLKYYVLAGSETTKSSLLTFFLAMVLHPNTQRKLQTELEMAFEGRLPELDELEDLPYLRAVVYEVYRYVLFASYLQQGFNQVCSWKPVVPLGMSSHICHYPNSYRQPFQRCATCCDESGHLRGIAYSRGISHPSQSIVSIGYQ
jgi:hypothetical protein